MFLFFSFHQIFGTLITETFGRRQVFLFSRPTYLAALLLESVEVEK